MALAENESIGREKYTCLQRMLQPCGLPVKQDDETAAQGTHAGKAT
jgi:Splicing factor 3B subunit 10 (SF3b10)